MKHSRVTSLLVLSLLVCLSVVCSAKSSQIKTDLIFMSSAMAMYKLNAGVYPTAEQGLKSLVVKPVAAPAPKRWTQILDKIPKDPWDRDYRYVVREKDGKITHVIISDGPDLANSVDNIEHVIEAKH